MSFLVHIKRKVNTLLDPIRFESGPLFLVLPTETPPILTFPVFSWKTPLPSQDMEPTVPYVQIGFYCIHVKWHTVKTRLKFSFLFPSIFCFCILRLRSSELTGVDPELVSPRHQSRKERDVIDLDTFLSESSNPRTLRTPGQDRSRRTCSVKLKSSQIFN